MVFTVTVKLLRYINHGRFCILNLMQLILEDLPSEFAKVLESYNREVTDIFSQYLATVAKWLGEGRGENYKLPLSGIGKKYLMRILVRIILYLLKPEYIFREYVSSVRDSMLLCVCLFSNKSQLTSKCGKYINMAHEAQASLTLMLSTHFGAICDLLLTLCTVTWSLFLLANGDAIYEFVLQ